MRASQWLLGFATTSAVVVAAVASGCGGNSSSSGGPVAEAGPADVSTNHPDTSVPEAAAETGAVDAAPEACASDADLTNLDLPDAEIGDSGYSTDACYACIQSTCGSELSSCGADCTCRIEVVAFLQCVASGTASPLTCGSALVTGGDQSGLPLLECLAGSAFPGGSGAGCLKVCGVNLPEGGAGEGGATEGGTSEAGPTDAGPG